jgi:hypothetical protein
MGYVFNHSPTTLLLSLTLIAGCTEHVPDQLNQPEVMVFVGSTACESCHSQEYENWRGSHHQLALQIATAETVLGDFSDIDFEYFGTHSRFLTRDDAFIVRTENADGQQQDFEITHTFGIEPLQQYLVDFPGGRRQALPFAWDSRSKDVGGQRWYHLNSDEYIAPDDPLHWTGQYFNWNAACAECHSTDLDVGYDLTSNSCSGQPIPDTLLGRFS